MSSDPPPWAAEPRRSTRKRSAATEADLERYVSVTKTEAGGCPTIESSWEIRDPLRSKRQRRASDKKDDGAFEPSGSGRPRKRPVPDEALNPFAKRNKVEHSMMTGSLGMAVIMPKIAHPDILLASSQDKSARSAHADGGSRDSELKPHLNSSSRSLVEPSPPTGSAIMHKIAHPFLPPSPQDKSAHSAHADWGSRAFEFKPHLNSSSQTLPLL